MSETASPHDDSFTVRQRVLEFLENEWPPANANDLYDLGWLKLPKLGKEACLRAALAAYEVSGDRLSESSYDVSARRSVERWVLDPSEENRQAAGRIASIQRPMPSKARTLANMAGSRNRWPTSVGSALARNPYFIGSSAFERIRDAIACELFQWASGESDPVAARFAE